MNAMHWWHFYISRKFYSRFLPILYRKTSKPNKQNQPRIKIHEPIENPINEDEFCSCICAVRCIRAANSCDYRTAKLWKHNYRTNCGVLTFIVPIWADLQADGQIGNVQMGRSTGQTTILAGSSARFAGFVARPANATLIGKTPRWAATDTGAIWKCGSGKEKSYIWLMVAENCCMQCSNMLD